MTCPAPVLLPIGQRIAFYALAAVVESWRGDDRAAEIYAERGAMLLRLLARMRRAASE